METNLEDSLNLESGMGVEFDQSEDTVINQADISLDGSGHEENIPMEYEHIEEQQMLMDTGSEEIIVSDLLGDQFTLQEYQTQEGQFSSSNNKLEESVMTSTSGGTDLQYGQTISVPASGVITEEMNLEPTYISIKAAAPSLRAIAPRKETIVLSKPLAPKQVAIAPKPTNIMAGAVQKIGQLGVGKQFAIAPKPLKGGPGPVTLVANKQFGQIVQKTDEKGNTVLAIGKQLVMMPPSQKVVKLVSGAGGVRIVPHSADQAQLIQNVTTSQAGNKMTKVVVQGSGSDLNQPAVITKLLSSSGAHATARYVTVQTSAASANVSSKVVMASPTKSGGIKYTVGKKPQLITIKSPAATVVPTTTAPQGTTTKKVVISSNPQTQNVILKANPKSGQVTKVSAGQRTQLHPINVPGKGIQYIRLVTNPNIAAKPASKPQAPAAPPTPQTFVMTDGRGNVIQMMADKLPTQPPPLIVTSAASSNKVSLKAPQKLIRLAPLTSKQGLAAMMSRGGQSLLAPLSPREPAPAGGGEAGEQQQPAGHMKQEIVVDEIVQEEPPDSKSALQALIADAVGNDADDTDHTHTSNTLDIEYHPSQNDEYEDSNSSGASRQDERTEHPLIVIPPYMNQDLMPTEQRSAYESSRGVGVGVGGVVGGAVHVELDVRAAYEAGGARSPAARSDRTLSDIDIPSELGMRPRKACNCTKSQCLKLYCDCFANGEFCNRCNCNNCHNNLENEELRQKAIRGCLDRNPNAFRPKIGKAKAGGVENFRQHNKGCNCKRSGCLKNYCECYEAKIACTNICKCVGCRNVEETLDRARRRSVSRPVPPPSHHPVTHAAPAPGKQPCSFMTTEVIEAVCQCLIAAAVESAGDGGGDPAPPRDPVPDVIDEFARCLQDIISASHQAAPLTLLDEAQA